MRRPIRKGVYRRLVGFLVGICCLSACEERGSAADFTVTSPGSFFSINGTANPTLTLIRGQTYTFAVSTTPGPFGHPFQINSPGVVNNNISSGTIAYTVPAAALNYTYICPIHLFGGQILTVDPAPPPPPTVQIVGISVTTNIVLTSTGTNTWSVIPEFNTNLATTNWFALTVQTNIFANGTNETFCGRPAGENVFLRIKAQPN
jgi:hypothetical protein